MTPPEDDANSAFIGMIAMTQSVITGGVFNQTNIQQCKSPMELLQEQVAHSAFHNSAQRIDAPRCHPNTRVVVKARAYRWITRDDTYPVSTSILWLNGPAGGGKSAIAQSLADQCHEEKLLLASFFFSRSDPLRSHAKHLIATIVYQVYQLVTPSTQHLILRAIQQDPLIWSKDIFTQFRVLIGNPLTHSEYFRHAQTPRLIVIDGLDECTDRISQQKILDLILKTLYEWHLPFLFLVASRPEPEIKTAFELPKMTTKLFAISLNDAYHPDADIELFLADKFQECRTTHPCRHHIPSDWPTKRAMHTLVRKSSGQFIYASVVVKYVTAIRHHPHRRLEIILNLRPASDLPFADLDAVYDQILSSVEDLPVVQRVISFRLLFYRFRVKEIETILDMEDGELQVAMSDMTSLVNISPEPQDCGGEILQIFHASFEDYLFDIARSRKYYIDRKRSFHTYAKIFISIVMKADVEDAQAISMCANILFSLPECLAGVDFDSDIAQSISSSFSMSAVQDRGRQSSKHGDWLVWMWVEHPLPAIIEALDGSKHPNAVVLCQHLLRDFDDLLSRHLSSYPKSIRFNFNLALIALIHESNLIPRGALAQTLRLDCDGGYETDKEDVLSSIMFLKEKTIQMISDYLLAPSRSHLYSVSPDIYSEGALFCLEYLCHHGSPTQAKMPTMSYRQRETRRMYPWKWNHRPFLEENRGPHITPWMWLTWPWERKTVLQPYWRDIIYAHLPLDDWATPIYDDSPVVYYRARSEKYWSALHYLTLFLPLASRSDVLGDMCRTKVFASKSQDFPKKSRRARTAMRQYLERWGYSLW